MEGANNGVHVLRTDHQLDALISSGVRMVVNCCAPWAVPCKQMNVVFDTLQQHTRKQHANAAVDEQAAVLFASMEAEKMPAVMKRYRISTVPTFLFFAARRLVRRSCGADARLLTSNVQWLSESSDAALLNAACDVVSALDEITLVMKGTVDEPKCAFSRQAVQVLRSGGVQFGTYNVLDDEEVRRVMKERFKWSTFPMVFAGGKLIGGIDVLREMADEGTLVQKLFNEGVEGGDDAKQAQNGVNKAQQEHETEQKDKQAEGQQAEGQQAEGQQAGARAEQDGVSVALRERLAALVNSSEVMLFMKGTPSAPRCGFSRKICELLREQHVQYEFFDILTDNEVRQGLKKVWQWATFPQLYAHGTLIGGLDIVKELVDSGELKKELAA